MKDFLKYVVATITGVSLLFFFIFLMGAVMLFSSVMSQYFRPSVHDGSLMRITLAGELVDRTTDNPLAQLLGNQNVDQTGLHALKAAIKEAKNNDKIKGIYLDGGMIGGSTALLQELRAALVDFKTSKKPIYSYSETYTQGGYYIASTADKVWLNPHGMLDWHGIAAQPIFYTELMEKVGVKMQVFKVGTFKSAVEPYILTKMSEPNRAQVTSFLGSLWKNMRDEVAQSRRLTSEGLNALADQYQALAEPQDYQKEKLVDGLLYQDQVRDELRKLTGDEEVTFAYPEDVLAESDAPSGDEGIAVYYCEGDIVGAEVDNSLSGNSMIVGSKVVADLDALAQNEDVKAVVIRINSGGGSAYASEQMWRAIQLLREKKPVVVSMGGMAASGGYYMACGANYIFAQPTTLTGSIGIFGMIPDASGLMTEKLGLHFDVVKTNEASDFGAMGRAFNAGEATAMQNYVNRGYLLFLNRVKAGRKSFKSLALVDSIAQGRVWTGEQALKIGLVDKLGSLDDAIAKAAELASLPKDGYFVEEFPEQLTWFEALEAEVDGKDYMERKVRLLLGEYYQPLLWTLTLEGRDRLQARLPYQLNLK